ncbi:signal peptidase I [Streptomyces sp. NBC_01207]|uniref:signal peptidase I n=1 Tax=Streptomyces sp. NBC_01207 TaxID=2903772 RepID=UPI002E0DF23C|nr:signal peptidase I [Streptomyces sp. NBC_01207]
MKNRPGRKRGIWAISLLILGVALNGIAFALMASQFKVHSYEGAAMLPTLPHGELVMVKSHPSEVHRGDIVTYDPVGWDRPAPNLGRVVAVGGDHIAYVKGDRTLTLNGQPLDEPYVLDGAPGAPDLAFAVSVPQGRVFILGDNRGNSEDSRYFAELQQGTLPVSAVAGLRVAEDNVLMGVLGLVSSVGTLALPVGIGLGIASLVARRKKQPVPAAPVWGAVHVDEP